MKDIIAKMTAIANADAAAAKKPTTKKSLTEGRGDDSNDRTAFGKRDWDAESENKPYDKYLEYKAKGGKLPRRQWEEDRDNGINEVSKNTASSYVAKASRFNKDNPTSPKKDNRNLGIARASSRANGGDLRLPPSEMRKGQVDEAQEDFDVKSGVWGDSGGPSDVKSHAVRADRPHRAVKKAEKEYEPGRKTWSVDRKQKKVDEAPSAGAMGRAAEREFSGYGQQAALAPVQSSTPMARQQSATASKPRMYVLKDPSGKVISKHASAPEAVAARKKLRNPGSFSMVKEGVKRPRGYTIVTESAKFRVSDPMLAKVLRRFPHEVSDFEHGADIDDHLYDALYDHYCNNGEMPYGTMKARDGDPYEWVANRLDMELKHGAASELRALGEGGSTANPEIEAIMDKYPYEAKQFKEFGELDDGPLYNELYDHYLNAGEMPYGVAKARTGDPVKWVAEQAERDLGIDAEGKGPDYFDSEEELSSHEDYTPPMERESIGDDFDMPETTPIVPQRGIGEDSVDPMLSVDDDVLTETSDEEMAMTLTDLGLDEGLDFFFDNGELHVIGSSTVRMAVNALASSTHGTPPSIQHVDGEEYKIVFDSEVVEGSVDPVKVPAYMRQQQGKNGGDSRYPLTLDQVRAPRADSISDPRNLAKANGTAIEENVNLNITADGEDDVLAIIRKLSGLSSESQDSFGDHDDEESELTGLPYPSVGVMGDMAGLSSAMDSISADHNDAENYEDEISAIVSGGDHEDHGEMDEAEYANSPEPEVHTSTTQMINQGNDLNRPKQMYARAQPGDNAMAVNPMREARALMRQYEAMKNSIKK